MKTNFFKRKKLNRKPRTRRERKRQAFAEQREWIMQFEKSLDQIMFSLNKLNYHMKGII